MMPWEYLARVAQRHTGPAPFGGANPNIIEKINADVQKDYPGNYKVIWDIDTSIGLNIIFENDEDKTMWLLKFNK